MVILRMEATTDMFAKNCGYKIVRPGMWAIRHYMLTPLPFVENERMFLCTRPIWTLQWPSVLSLRTKPPKIFPIASRWHFEQKSLIHLNQHTSSGFSMCSWHRAVKLITPDVHFNTNYCTEREKKIARKECTGYETERTLPGKRFHVPFLHLNLRKYSGE